MLLMNKIIFLDKNNKNISLNPLRKKMNLKKEKQSKHLKVQQFLIIFNILNLSTICKQLSKI